MFASSGLPNVGVVAQVLGATAFRNSIGQMTSQIGGLNRATTNLARTSVAGWASISNSSGATAGTVVRVSGVIAAAITGVTAAFKGLAAAGVVQQSLKNIEILSGATEREIAGLGTTVLDLSKKYGVFANEITRTATELSKGGISLSQMEGGALEAAVAFQKATIGEVDFVRSTQLVIQGMRQYGIAANDANRIVDALTIAANKSTASVGDLAAGFQQAVIPRQVGASIEEVAASLAILNSNAQKGTIGGTSLRNTFLRLLDPSKEALEIMKKYNISIFDAQGRSIGFRNVLVRLIEAFKTTGNAAEDAQRAFDQASLFGARQGTAVTAFLKSGIEGFDELVDSIKNLPGAVRQAERQLDTIPSQINRIRTVLEALVIQGLKPVDDALVPVAAKVADLLGLLNAGAVGTGLINFGKGLVSLVKELQPLAAGIVAAATNLSKLDAGFNVSRQLLDGLKFALSTFSTIVGIAATAISLLAEKILKLPFAPQIAALALFIVPLVALSLLAITVTVALAGMLTVLGKIILISAAVAAAIILIPRALEVLPGIVKSIVDAFVASFFRGIDNIINAGKRLGAELLRLNDVLNTFFFGSVENDVFDQITQSLIKLVANIPGLIGTFVNEITTGLNGIVDAFAGLAQTIQDVFTFAFAVLLDTSMKDLEDFRNFNQKTLSGFLDDFAVIFTDVTNIVSDFSVRVLGIILSNIHQFFNNAVDIGIAFLSSWGLTWENAANIVGNALNNIANNLAGFAKAFLAGVVAGSPLAVLVPEFKALAAAGSFVAAKLSNAFEAVSNGVKKLSADITANLREATLSIQKHVLDAQTELTKLANAAALADQRRGERGGSTPRPSDIDFGDDPGTSTFPSSGGGGGKDAGDSIRDLTRQIQAALSDIPGAGKQLASFLADIAKDAPQRLAPMINAIRAVKIQIAQTTIAARSLARVNAEIAASNKRAAALQATLGRIEIQQSLALIGFDRQLLGIRQQLVALDRESWSTRDRLVAIERQITKLQQENLDLAKQRIELELQVLPIRHQIEDIDTRIAELQRADLNIAKQRAELELKLLPVKHAIEDIDEKIAILQRENFERIGQVLRLELQALPIRQQIARVDAQISRIHSDDLRLIEDRIREEVVILATRQKIAALERDITNSANKQLTLARRAQELGGEGAVAALEDQLADIDKQLETARGSTARDLLRQREGVNAQLETEQKNLEKLNRQQQDQARIEELARIALEQQKIAIEASIDPNLRRIELIQNEEELIRLLADLRKNQLEQEKRLLEENLIPIEDKLLSIQQQIELEKLLISIQVNSLEQQRQIQQDLAKVIEDRLRLLEREKELADARVAVTVAGLEIEKRVLEEQLDPLNKKLVLIQRQEELERLRNSLVIAGLEAERRALQEGLQAIDDRRLAIERNIATIELEREAVRLSFEEQKIGVQEQLLQEQLRRAELEETRLKQQAIFEEMALALAQQLLQSEAFTTEEAAEVGKRLNLWNDEVDAIQKRVTEMAALEEAAKLAEAILGTVAEQNDITLKSFNLLGVEITETTKQTEALTKQVDTKNRPAYEKLTRELDENNRPAFEKLTDQIVQENEPAFANLTLALDEANRPAFEALTAELKDNNLVVFTALSEHIKSQVRPEFENLTSLLDTHVSPAFSDLTALLNEHTRPAFENLTLEIKSNLIEALGAATAKIHDSMNPALAAIKGELDKAAEAARNFKGDLDAIPREITVTITTVYRTIGSPGPGGGPSQPSQPGQPAQPGQPSEGPAQPGDDPNRDPPGGTTGSMIAATRASAQVNQIVNSPSYVVNASYQNIQSPASVALDMRALIALASR